MFESSLMMFLPQKPVLADAINLDYMLPKVLALLNHPCIHTFIFRCSPQGFSATCLQQMQGSVVEGLSQTAKSGLQ